jgi:hypothetical protein
LVWGIKEINQNTTMIRNKVNSKKITSSDLHLSAKGMATLQRIEALQRYMPSSLSRASLSLRMGEQYQGVRKIYQALGYPEEQDLTFEYFYNKWDRQDIANAVIEKPIAKTWSGNLNITEIGAVEGQSPLAKEWKSLNKRLKVKKELARLDTLDGIGQYALLLFGFNDVQKKEDWVRPAGAKLKLNFIRSISEGTSKVLELENDSNNERFGQPKYYELEISQPGESANDVLIRTIKVHHSRILHVASGSLVSNIYGVSRLKPIVNRLEDLEKIMGGDAETFWRGARPGYHAKPEPDFKMTPDDEDALDEELDKYEHDLRRIIYAQGIDLNSLDQQIADPSNHVDIQLQAISAQTTIPKRILVGSERGELSSSQDKDQWLGVIADRRENYAEPELMEPFVDKCMSHGILTQVEYTVIWSELFSPSEKEKVEIGKLRAEALKSYFSEPMANEIVPIDLAMKYILGLDKDQLEEFMEELGDLAEIEDRRMSGVEAELKLEDETKKIRRTKQNTVNKLVQPINI